MKYRQLGSKGLLVSEIGFGGWGIGGVVRNAASYGPVNDDRSRRALRCALDCGVTFYDTSDLYGYGHSEEVIGDAFRRDRSRIVIASKVGFLDSTSQDFSPAHIRRSLEDTLRRLKSDYVDVYQLHNPPLAADEPAQSALAALLALRQEGKVRAVGISVRSPEEGALAVQLGVEAVQVNLNMIDQRAVGSGVLQACGGAGTGVICRTPLCYGFLSAKYGSAHEFGDGDHRRDWTAAQRALWAEAPALFDSIRQRERQTAAQFALRFCLSFPEVSTVIPGMLSPEDVEENVVASELGPLSIEDRQSIERVYSEHGFFLGRETQRAAEAFS